MQRLLHVGTPTRLRRTTAFTFWHASVFSFKRQKTGSRCGLNAGWKEVSFLKITRKAESEKGHVSRAELKEEDTQIGFSTTFSQRMMGWVKIQGVCAAVDLKG